MLLQHVTATYVAAKYVTVKYVTATYVSATYFTYSPNMVLTIIFASLALTFIAVQTGYREINHSPVEVTGAKITNIRVNPFFSLNIHHVEKAVDPNKVLIRKVSFFITSRFTTSFPPELEIKVAYQFLVKVSNSSLSRNPQHMLMDLRRHAIAITNTFMNFMQRRTN
jgi:hypothetical protein